jgi:hypothetical protein
LTALLLLPLLACQSDGGLTVHNSAPDADVTSHEDGDVVYEGETIVLRGTGSDPLGGSLVASWYAEGFILCPFEPVADDGTTTCETALSADQTQITLEVRDEDDAAGSDHVSLEVVPRKVPNQAPTCALVGPADGSVASPGSVVVIQGTVADPDGSLGQLNVWIDSDIDGLLGTPTPDSKGAVELATAALAQATHRLSLTVVDGAGGTCTDQILFTVGSPPELTIVAPYDGALWNEGTTVAFQATVVDGDEAPESLGVRFSSSLDGVLFDGAPDTTGGVSFTNEALSRGVHTVTATATDADGFYDEEVVTFTINGTPLAPGLSLTPDPPRTDDDLAVVITGGSVDPEGESVSYRYAWSRNGVPSTASTTDVLPASATAKGETWTVEVTPEDPHGSGEMNSVSTVIANTAPATPTVTIDPTDPEEGVDTLVCEVGYPTFDADGDTVTYTVGWTVDGVAYSGATTTTLLDDTVQGSETVAEEHWVCSVTPDDGTEVGSAGVAAVDILGTPIDYAHVQYPCSDSIPRTTGTLDVYAWVFHPDVTNDYGQGPGITAEVGVGDDGTDPETSTSWVWTPATFSKDQPAYGDASRDPLPYNNDEYVGTLEAPSTTGDFDYAFRFSTDNGLSWVMVDLGGTSCGGEGTIDGYDPADAGDLTVYP